MQFMSFYLYYKCSFTYRDCFNCYLPTEHKHQNKELKFLHRYYTVLTVILKIVYNEQPGKIQTF